MQNGNLGICDSQEQLACGIQGAEAKERDMGMGKAVEQGRCCPWPSIQEAEESQVQGWLEQHSEQLALSSASLGGTVDSNQLGLCSKVQASLCYVVRPFFS